MAREALSDYLQVGRLWDGDAMVGTIRSWPGARGIDRVECLWEPGMLLAARLRDALGLPGLSREQTVPFRDKGVMKEVLDRAGLRTPRAPPGADRGRSARRGRGDRLPADRQAHRRRGVGGHLPRGRSGRPSSGSCG